MQKKKGYAVELKSLASSQASWVGNERHPHQTNVSISLKFREGFIVFIGVFINRSTVSQASKHTSCYSLAFALLHVLKVKKIQ